MITTASNHSSPSPASPSSLIPPPSALSPSDSSLLSALFTPAATRDSITAAHDLTPAALALWLAQPHIQPAYQAMLALEDHFRRQWADQHYRTAIETLTEVQKASDSLPERRCAATSALAALRHRSAPTVPLRNAEGVARVREGRGRPVPETAPSADDPTQSSVLSPQHFTSHPTPPPEHSAPSTEHSPSSPSSLADRVISALQDSPTPAVIDAVRDLAGGPAADADPHACPYERGLQLLLAALPGAHVTAAPADMEPEAQARVTEPEAQARSRVHHFTKRYSLSHPGSDPIHFLFRLGYNPERDDCWIEDIAVLDSS